MALFNCSKQYFLISQILNQLIDIAVKDERNQHAIFDNIPLIAQIQLHHIVGGQQQDAALCLVLLQINGNFLLAG